MTMIEHVDGAISVEPKQDANVVVRARDLYAIYCAFSGGLNYESKSCPPWEKLGHRVRNSWYGVALRSIQHQLCDADMDRLGEENKILPNSTVFGHLGEAESETAVRTWTEYSR